MLNLVKGAYFAHFVFFYIFSAFVKYYFHVKCHNMAILGQWISFHFCSKNDKKVCFSTYTYFWQKNRVFIKNTHSQALKKLLIKFIAYIIFVYFKMYTLFKMHVAGL